MENFTLERFLLYQKTCIYPRMADENIVDEDVSTCLYAAYLTFERRFQDQENNLVLLFSLLT